MSDDLIKELAKIFHNSWCQNKLCHQAEESRDVEGWKVEEDGEECLSSIGAAWFKLTKSAQIVNINVDYEKLPKEIQEENEMAVRDVLEIIFDLIKENEKSDVKKLEKKKSLELDRFSYINELEKVDVEQASEKVHQKWMERNLKNEKNKFLYVCYQELSEEQKEKDRIQVKIVLDFLSKLKEQKY